MHAELVKDGGDKATLRIRGTLYDAQFSGEKPSSKTFRVEILKTAPMEVRLLGEETASKGGTIKLTGGNLPLGANVDVTVARSDKGMFLLLIGGKEFFAKLPANMAGLSSFQAKVVSTDPLLLQPSPTDLMQRGDVKSSLISLLNKDPATIASEIGAGRLSSITAGELRQLIRNSGLFFENKLAGDQSVAGDNKLRAAMQNNNTQWDGITRMQLATILMDEGFFSFFEMDEIEDEGVIRIRQEPTGISLYMKMTFTAIGDTVLSIVPQPLGDGYNVTVRTSVDISVQLAAVNIDKATIKWGALRKNDLAQFSIKDRIIGKIGGFDIKV
ncbi:MAG: hypothetical protein LBV09_06340 [Deferribacteraceae bacterium]|nr:hypothetical protein [Deferribacteraceae bacterium]